jgi:hypothetical protein
MGRGSLLRPPPPPSPFPHSFAGLDPTPLCPSFHFRRLGVLGVRLRDPLRVERCGPRERGKERGDRDSARDRDGDRERQGGGEQKRESGERGRGRQIEKWIDD